MRAVRRLSSVARVPKTPEEARALQERMQQWARAPGARDSISLRKHEAGHYPEPKDTYHYAKQRGFTGAEDSTEFAALSGLLSNPLTVAAGIWLAGLASRPHLSVLLVGARSEATLPAIWWKETLLTLPQVSGLAITFSGIDMPSNIPPFAEAEMRETNQQLTLRRLPAGAFHNTPNCENILEDSDVCFLLNPGIGHPRLKDRWRPTVEMICKSGKRVVSTAHGEFDLRRDEQELRTAYDVEWIHQPMPNPFMSMRVTVDANEPEQQVVTPNMFIHAWRGKSQQPQHQQQRKGQRMVK